MSYWMKNYLTIITEVVAMILSSLWLLMIFYLTTPAANKFLDLGGTFQNDTPESKNVEKHCDLAKKLAK